MTRPAAPTDRPKKVKEKEVFLPYQREYVRVRFMAGDSFSQIAKQNPWAYDLEECEDALREDNRIRKARP